MLENLCTHARTHAGDDDVRLFVIGTLLGIVSMKLCLQFLVFTLELNDLTLCTLHIVQRQFEFLVLGLQFLVCAPGEWSVCSS
jgi:hypothetical protein